MSEDSVHPVKKSPYRMGWLLVMFDLPVLSPEQRREATDFRKKLLDEAFIMIQFSVYARPCTDWERLEKHRLRLESYAPRAGNIRCLFLTDRQWSQGFNLMGPNFKQGARQLELNIPTQTEFWD
jgi:CRISPR-associated protein Cas2